MSQFDGIVTELKKLKTNFNYKQQKNILLTK